MGLRSSSRYEDYIDEWTLAIRAGKVLRETVTIRIFKQQYQFLSEESQEINQAGGQ